MLKKSLIALAVLAIAVPALAGNPVDANKFHKPWESYTVYEWKDITTFDVVLDVGYWIQIELEGDIEVSQDATLGDPYYSYSGCLEGVEVKTNFPATIKSSASATSSADGDWNAKMRLNGSGIAPSSTLDIPVTGATIDICVTGTNVKIGELPQADNVKVAQVTISVIPTQYK